MVCRVGLGQGESHVCGHPVSEEFIMKLNCSKVLTIARTNAATAKD